VSGAAGGRRRHVDHEEEEHENEERWLVSFADMMTLMFALFMVLFSISSVNTSKFDSLKRSLKESFSGAILPGGTAIRETGASASSTNQATPAPPQPALMPRAAIAASFAKQKKDAGADAAKAEQKDFVSLKQRIDAAAAKLGLENKVSTVIRANGLAVRLLTDGVLFDSGRAELRPGAKQLLDPIGVILRNERRHPIVVEGYTDSAPVRSTLYPTNWELSGARASRVVRHFLGDGVAMRRLSGVAYAYQHPIASNASATGRSRNRRVEVVLTRLNPSPGRTS
jgi:chemotaxis protein MotB